MLGLPLFENPARASQMFNSGKLLRCIVLKFVRDVGYHLRR